MFMKTVFKCHSLSFVIFLCNFRPHVLRIRSCVAVFVMLVRSQCVRSAVAGQ